MAAHRVPDLPPVERRLRVLLFEQKGRSLNAVNVHQIVTRLGHGEVSLTAFLEPAMEVLELLVLLKHVIHICNEHAGGLRHLALLLLGPLRLAHLLAVVHRRANLVLLLQDFYLLVFTPNHHFERRLAFKTMLQKSNRRARLDQETLEGW